MAPAGRWDGSALTESASTPTGSLSQPAASTTAPALRPPTWPRALSRRVAARTFAAGVAVCTSAVALFVLVQLRAWPPHEDETLALFVGRQPFGDVLETVLGRRGGAPLHFLVAYAIAHLGGGLVALRLASALFAVASVPAIALLGARLAGRAAGLGAAALASASWVLLFHGVYGRMYSLFLLTSTLSYLALLRALERGGRGAWAAWCVAVLATVATHPYGALVLATQAVYVVLRRDRLREAAIACGVALAAGTPFWLTDLVLAGRFDVGVGGGGDKLGSPGSVFGYLWTVAGDMSSGYAAVLVAVLALAATGLVLLARERRESALLVASVFAVPTVAFLAARLGSQTSPESRHLIFALPFFSTVVALPLTRLARRSHPLAPAVAAAAVVALAGGEVAWAWHKTPPLFTGEPAVRVRAREAASAWLARTERRDDILFGYDPLYLGAWERDRAAGPRTVVPRADVKLALDVLEGARKPLGRGVWVLDASDTNNYDPKLSIPLRVPRPASAFEARVFGPFLVVRTREPTRSLRRYLRRAIAVQAVGQSLFIGDADINLDTMKRAAERYGIFGGRR